MKTKVVLGACVLVVAILVSMAVSYAESFVNHQEDVELKCDVDSNH